MKSEACLPVETTLLKPSSKIVLPSEITEDPVDILLSVLRHTACCSLSSSSAEEAPAVSSVHTVGDVLWRIMVMLKAILMLVYDVSTSEHDDRRFSVVGPNLDNNL